MKECIIIQQHSKDIFKNEINKKINEGYKIINSQMQYISDMHLRPFIYYALLIKEE